MFGVRWIWAQLLCTLAEVYLAYLDVRSCLARDLSIFPRSVKGTVAAGMHDLSMSFSLWHNSGSDLTTGSVSRVVRAPCMARRLAALRRGAARATQPQTT